MSVLNMTSDGAPNVLWAICKALLEFGPMTRERLLRLCAANERCAQSLVRWSQLGLIHKVDDQFCVSPDYAKKIKVGSGEVCPEFLRALRQVVFLPQNSARLWEAEGSQCADLTRGLSWLLAQNIYSVDTSSAVVVQQLESVQVKDETKRILQNDTRWNGLRTWAIFLGFGYSSEHTMPDPTLAVEAELSGLFVEHKVLSASEFLEGLADRLPVLDNGAIRSQVESILDPSEWQQPPENYLSTSLSRAIVRLASAGKIGLENRSDSPSHLALQGSGAQEWRRFTHVSFKEG